MTAGGRLTPQVVIRLVYVAAMFLVAMDATIVNVALLSIGSELQVSPAAAGTVNIGYLVAIAMSLPAAGWLGDRFGAKRVLLTAITVFTAASLCCGLSASFEQLTIFRILQGAGGGLIAPVGMAMLFRAFPPEERARVSRSLILPIAVAPAIGPVIGGFFVEQLSWRWCFYLNVPVGVAAVCLGLVLLRDEHRPAGLRFDLPGFLLSSPGFAMLVYALSQGTVHGWTSPWVLTAGLGGTLLLSILVAVELRTRQPLLQLRLYGDRLLRTSAVIGFCVAAGLLGMLYVFPLMYQDAFGASALDSGLTTFPEALGLMAASQLMPWSSRKLGLRRLLALALTGAMLIFGGMCLVQADTNPWLIRALMLGGGFTLGHAVGTVQLLAFANVAPASMGQAAALFQVQNRLGSAVGVALLGSILGIAGSAEVPASAAAAAAAVPAAAYQAALLGAAGFLFVAWCMSLTLRREDEEAAAGARKPQAPPRAPAQEKAAVS